MATTYGSAAPDFSSKPWVYVVAPLAAVAALGLVAALLHTQRRKRLLKTRLHYVSSDPSARQALERDLQEAWMRGAPSHEHQQRQLVRGMRRWSRNTNGGGRWAWARDFLSARGDEGLNELGEAPPPYSGRQRKIDEAGDVILMESPPSGRGLGSGSRTEGAPEARVQDDSGTHPGLPPAYDGPAEAAPGRPAPIAEPSAALVTGPRSSNPST